LLETLIPDFLQIPDIIECRDKTDRHSRKIIVGNSVQWYLMFYIRVEKWLISICAGVL